MVKDEDGLTPQQRKFVELVIETGKPHEAFMRAYGRQHAGREVGQVLRVPAVAAALAKERGIARAKHGITLEYLTEQALTALQMAEAQGDPRSMTSCIERLSRMYGWESADRKNDRDPLKHLTDDDADELMAAIERRKAAADGTKSTTH